MITFLLNWILTWLPIGLFIIFQPEIRRAFAQLGSFAIWKGKRRREVIGELVAATGNMARRKCGALIVVERRIGMQTLIDDSVKLDIKVNAMVLESIFFPNSPLHDGAVIIRDDRIVAARAILPLTRVENISRRLGTRHRAALGISEDTDAVTIVVSEETGTISIALSRRSAPRPGDQRAGELSGKADHPGAGRRRSRRDRADARRTVRTAKRGAFVIWRESSEKFILSSARTSGGK